MRPDKTNVEQASTIRRILTSIANHHDVWLELLENGCSALTHLNLSPEAQTAISSGDVQWMYENVGDITEKQKDFLHRRRKCLA